MSDRLDRHLGKGKLLVIDGDEFKIKPLGIKSLPQLFKVAKQLDGIDLKKENIMSRLKPETMEILVDLVMDTLHKSFPDKELNLLRNRILHHYHQFFLRSIHSF